MANKLQNFGYFLAAEEDTPGSGTKVGGGALADSDALYAENIKLGEDIASVKRTGASVYPVGWKSAPSTRTPMGQLDAEIAAFPIAYFVSGKHARPPIHPVLCMLGFRVIAETAYVSGTSNPRIVYGLDPLGAPTALCEFRQRIEDTADSFYDVSMDGAVAEGSLECTTGDRLMLKVSKLVGTNIDRNEPVTHANFAPSYADGGVVDDGGSNASLSTHRVPCVGLDTVFSLVFTDAEGTTTTYEGNGINGLTVSLNNNVQTPRTMSSNGGVASAIRVPQEAYPISFTLDPDSLDVFDPYALAIAKTTGALALTFSDGEDAKHKVRLDLPFTIDSVDEDYEDGRLVYKISGSVVYTDQATPDQPVRLTFFSDYEETGEP